MSFNQALPQAMDGVASPERRLQGINGPGELKKIKSA